MSEGNGKLPAGWQTPKLGDLIIEAATGFACGQRANDGAIQLRMNNVTRRGELDWSSFIRVPADKAMLDYYALQAGDVVFNNTNSTEMVGKTALFGGFDELVVFSNHFTRLRTKPDALAPDFLALWLHSQWQAGLFARICDRWIGQSAVQRNKLLALEIPLPPLEEQRRIAARLREQLSILTEARAAFEAQRAAAESLPAAHLRAVFESEEANQWPRRRLGEIVTRIGSGFTPLGGQTTYKLSGIPLIRSQNVLINRFTADGLAFISKEQDEEMESSRVQAGDVLLNITGASIGRVCVAPSEICPANVNQHVSVIRSDGGLDSRFLSFFVSSPDFQKFIWRTQAGATRQALTKQIIENFMVPVPSLETQRSIADKLSMELDETQVLRQSLKTKLSELEKLPAALLRSAFNPSGD